MGLPSLRSATDLFQQVFSHASPGQDARGIKLELRELALSRRPLLRTHSHVGIRQQTRRRRRGAGCALPRRTKRLELLL